LLIRRGSFVANKELPREKVLPLFVSTEKPLVPLILCMDLGFEEKADLGSIGVSLQGSQNLVEDMIFGRITLCESQ
jgi:hypothetical protein